MLNRYGKIYVIDYHRSLDTTSLILEVQYRGLSDLSNGVQSSFTASTLSSRPGPIVFRRKMHLKGGLSGTEVSGDTRGVLKSGCP